MTEPEPRRLALSDILEGGAALVARNLLVFVRITATLIVPVNLVFIALLLALHDDSTPKKMGYVFIAVYLLLVLLALIVAAGACLKAAADIRVGTSTSARGSLCFVRDRLSSFLWLVALMLAGIGPGVALFVMARARPLGGLAYLAIVLIPFSFSLAGFWSVAPPSLLVEGGGVVKALKRSRTLVRGSYWRSLGTVVFGSALALFAGILVQLIASVFASGSETVRLVVIVCGAAFGEVVAVSLLAAYLIVLYYDLRVRKEGSASIERDSAPIAGTGAPVATSKTEPVKRRSPRR
ncbi:MAG: hypothetical protein ABSB96_03770 [Gaiellaceae bacterium]